MSESVIEGHIVDRPLKQVMQTEISPHKEVKAHEEQVCYPRESLSLTEAATVTNILDTCGWLGYSPPFFPSKVATANCFPIFFSFGRSVNFFPRSCLQKAGTL